MPERPPRPGQPPGPPPRGGGDPPFPPNPGITGMDDQVDAFAELQAFFRQYGLEGLESWAWDQILSDASKSQVLLTMYDQPAFRERFPAIEARRAAGLSPITIDAYVAYESMAYGMMRSAGLPPGFYDTTSDFSDLIAADVSVAELEQRINNGYVAVAESPAEVRAAFAEFYGADGDGALAAFFMDPDVATPVLRQRVAAAQIAGRGGMAGFGLDQARAEELALAGVTGDAAADAFARLDQQRGLFRETVGDTADLTAEGEGLDAALGFGGDAVRRRAAERAAVFSGGGGAYLTGEGVAGAGTERG